MRCAQRRAERGGGSFTTISEAMKLWKAGRAAASAAPVREAAPAAVSERLAEVWTLTMDLAHQRLQAEPDALEVLRSEAADAIGAELDAARQQIAAQAEALGASAHQGAQMHAELDRLTAAHAAQVEADHVMQAQLTEVRLRCDQLAAQVDAERARTRETAQAGAAEVAKLTAELDAARVLAGSAREDAAHLRGRLDATQAQADALMRHMAAATASQALPEPEGTAPAPSVTAKAPTRAKR